MCSITYTVHRQQTTFGLVIRERRAEKAASDRAYSLRQVAARINLEPSYLSKIERGEEKPPGELTIRRLAVQLDQDADTLLALAGKVSSDLVEIIRERPVAVAELLRSIRKTPTERVTEIAREVRDGEW